MRLAVLGASVSGRPNVRAGHEPSFARRADCMTPSPRLRGEGWGEGRALRSSQALLHLTRLLAGGSPAAGPFLLLAQKKEAKEKGPPPRWPSASLSRQAQAGQCGNSLRHNFKGSEARTSALLCHVNYSTGVSPPSAAAQRGLPRPTVVRARQALAMIEALAPSDALRHVEPLRVGGRGYSRTCGSPLRGAPAYCSRPPLTPTLSPQAGRGGP